MGDIVTKKIDLPELIKVQNSHVTQHTSGHKKTDWKIEANISNEQLGTLPSRLLEAEVFSIMRFIKKFELEAFNIGIQFGKEKQMQMYDPLLKEYKRKLNLAKNENERLAEVLDRLTKQEV